MKKNNLKKIDISKKISDCTGYPLIYSKKIVDDLLLALSNVIKGNQLNLKNIGVFKIKIKNERFGRNPKTLKSHIISKRYSIKFTPSSNLKKKINLKKL